MGEKSLKSPDGHRLIVGVMSGTSADGIDVAVCRVGQARQGWGELVWHQGVPYSAEVRNWIHEVRRLGACTLGELGEWTRRITLEHAGAVRMALAGSGVELGEGDAVADHGQTLFHAPPVTMQVLDPALLAWEVGARVVSDFRRADCAAGGQGAPLVPYADWRLFRSEESTRALVNLGGIANVTILPKDGGIEKLVAFDTGPANCLSDYICRTLESMGQGFDAGGKLAAQGRVDEGVVGRFLRGDYFARTSPKSTDGPEMTGLFEEAGGMGLRLTDALATAAECVARSCVDAVLKAGEERGGVDEVVVSGGGVYHGPLMRRMTELLAREQVVMKTTDELGVPSAAKEAIAFALLGQACLEREVGNVISCTGAKRGVVLGSVTPKP